MLKRQGKLVSPPKLALPSARGGHTLEFDACNVHVGCVLLQEQPNGKSKLVGYWSGSLAKARQAYNTTQREYFAIMGSVLMLRFYLEGTKIMIQREHYLLQWMLNLADATGCLAPWRLHLFKLGFNVVYCKGTKNKFFDVLSRPQITGVHNKFTEDDFTAADIDIDTLDCTKLRLENNNQAIYQAIGDEDVLNEKAGTTILDFVLHQAADVYCNQGALSVRMANAEYKVDKSGLIVQVEPIDDSVESIVPKALYDRLFYPSHHPVLVGHPDQRRKHNSIRREFSRQKWLTIRIQLTVVAVHANIIAHQQGRKENYSCFRKWLT